MHLIKVTQMAQPAVTADGPQGKKVVSPPVRAIDFFINPDHIVGIVAGSEPLLTTEVQFVNGLILVVQGNANEWAKRLSAPVELYASAAV